MPERNTPDRTAWFEELRANGEPVPCMHPDDFAAKIERIGQFLEENPELSESAIDAPAVEPVKIDDAPRPGRDL